MVKLIALFLLMMVSGHSPALSEDINYGRVEISFDYNRAARDYANNQFAVWIEDLKGNLVNTITLLSATTFGKILYCTAAKYELVTMKIATEPWHSFLQKARKNIPSSRMSQQNIYRLNSAAAMGTGRAGK